MGTARRGVLGLLSASTALVVAGCGGGLNVPSGAGSTAPSQVKPLRVVSVSPAALSGTSPIVVTFKRPLTEQSPNPTLLPAVPGRWTRAGSTATFTPTQAYPPDSHIAVSIVRKPGAPSHEVATVSSGNGSLRFAQQILSRLQYLPLTSAAAKPTDATAAAAAVYQAPRGRFAWRYPDTPKSLKKAWVAGQPNTLLRGAVIAFQHDHNITADGAVGPQTWKELMAADLANDVDPHSYSYVSADLYLPQRLTVWVDGRTAVSSPVNGGVAGAPTPLGTYPVYLRYAATTMQGTNPDGSHYKDPGVPWVNYFSGGSAVHGFPRSSYGSPQSVGCLELPISTAKRVYNLISYGTLVHVGGPFVPKTIATPAPPKTPKPHSSSSAKPNASPTLTTSKHTTPSPTPSKSSKHH
jgi:peptidoglycan hydrolase-like protein with peptidoglycan-binding domain